MNLLTIVGNAAADDNFLDKLFENPLGTVKEYGFQLTIYEQEGLLELTQGKKSTQNKENLKQVYICPQKPCHYAIVHPGETVATKERPKVA